MEFEHYRLNMVVGLFSNLLWTDAHNMPDNYTQCARYCRFSACERRAVHRRIADIVVQNSDHDSLNFRNHNI